MNIVVGTDAPRTVAIHEFLEYVYLGFCNSSRKDFYVVFYDDEAIRRRMPPTNKSVKVSNGCFKIDDNNRKTSFNNIRDSTTMQIPRDNGNIDIHSPFS